MPLKNIAKPHVKIIRKQNFLQSLLQEKNLLKGRIEIPNKEERERGNIMKDPSNKKTENANVEFAQEFGDVNSFKFFEYPFMNQNNAKTKKKKKK
jgi:hypothetical protein